ncbi:hypothetical protein AVEN_140338-1 [Araneus ventricosus]|uniref:Endonuclease/exonuclease/phosphatase domain-containing protein n=1 Tax=Araneus ventricosus TaxID=182803 RepID=A0A4Y2V807_ARAVE|nr:hypothetical protein AVEN_140338-1 [Araneus ventricosus]
MVGGAVGPEYLPLSHGQKKSGPFSGQQIVSNSKISKFPTVFLIKRVSTSGETFHSVSPFLVERAITGSIGDVKSTKKLRSGDLLVEVQSRKQSEQIVQLKTFSNILITLSPHATLNSSKGVITCGELLNVPIEEILKELQGQGVSHVRRISILRDGQLLNTKQLILTFDSAKLPENIKHGQVWLLRQNTKTHSLTHSPKVEKITKFYTSSRREVLNTVPTKDDTCTHQSALKPFETKKPTSVDTQLLPMAVLPPLEQTVLQSRESDADAEMSSSSLSEEDALEYDMSEDLEDSPAVISPPPSSKPEKGDKYKNSLAKNGSCAIKPQTTKPSSSLVIAYRQNRKSSSLANNKVEGLSDRFSPADSLPPPWSSRTYRIGNRLQRILKSKDSQSISLSLVSQAFPYRQISINSSIQAVAVQLHVVSLLTICCIYLPPNDNIPQQEIDDLIKQLPQPFILMGDFNGHNPIW